GLNPVYSAVYICPWSEMLYGILPDYNESAVQSVQNLLHQWLDRTNNFYNQQYCSVITV
ncbi:hypothetical protein BC833DRAFT_613610, partial [Globomyces pollinis-pini]